MALFPKDFKGNNFYVWIGTFALLLMLWLWVGPKLVRKPAGTPPRAGSNEEAKEISKAVAGVPPQPVKGRIPGVFQSPSTAAAIGGSGLIPTGGGGGLRNIGISPTNTMPPLGATRFANAATINRVTLA